MSDLLEIDGLKISFDTRAGIVDAVKNVSIHLKRGETLGIVGESGSGKSVTSYGLMRILDRNGRIREGSITYGGVDLIAATEKQMSDIRGREISMIFQNPRAALNPIRKVGKQIEDVLIRHHQASRGNAKHKAIEALKAVRIRNPEERYHAYPFELSGGMCQRIVIALALACDPRLLIADEPTTGLDVTTQKAIMDLVSELIRERDMSAILITHDLGLAASYCDRIAVMRNGEVVEEGLAEDIFARPQHEYTQKLMQATPREGISVRELLPQEQKTPMPQRTLSSLPLLQIRNLVKEFAGEKGPVRAVNDISFTVNEGETLGLVGESGCGKSTTSSMIMRLLDPTSGEIIFAGDDLAKTPSKGFAKDPRRAKLQMVFQDATDSLNPRFTARQVISDPIDRLGTLSANQKNVRIEELASLVGLPHHLLERFPHQLSGGQKARVGIARAIALDPKLLILDEPTAALDVSIQAVVLNLLVDLRAKLNMSYIFVSHDLHVVGLLCDRVVVMQNGEIVEAGIASEVMRNPQHPYTRQLLEAAPKPPFQENTTSDYHDTYSKTAV